MKVRLTQGTTGVVKEAPTGFSWTTFFFGFFPALFRGDWKWAIIMAVVALITAGFSWLVFPFFYNKLYIRELLEKGYKASDTGSQHVLRAKGYVHL